MRMPPFLHSDYHPLWTPYVVGDRRKRTSTVSVVSGTDRTQSNKNAAAAPIPSLQPRAVDASLDGPKSEEDEEVDSDGGPVQKPGRRCTIVRRADGTRACCDAGIALSLALLIGCRVSDKKLPESAPSLTQIRYRLLGHELLFRQVR